MGLGSMEWGFFKGKRVLVTGYTGFKGMWLCKILELAGADVTGYALAPLTQVGQQVLEQSGIVAGMRAVPGDVRDFAHLQETFEWARPEIVLHLAAQPIVRESYRDPVGTYATNVMGTVHVLECIRQSDTVRSFLNVTTDKVYENKEWCWGYRENEPLDGFDPYSNSKSCSELVTHSYKKSFLAEAGTAVSTARAGNVIGGGDFAADRIIPDCIRAAYAGQIIEVRSPFSVRPYQHVLEPLAAYLRIVQAQYEDPSLAGAYNVGPDSCDCLTTGALVELFCKAWGEGLRWLDTGNDGPHEARFLKLDCAKLKETFQWQPRWHIAEAVTKTVEWAKLYQAKGDVAACMEAQIQAFAAAVLQS